MAVKVTQERRGAGDDQFCIDAAQLWRDCCRGEEKAWRILFSWCRKKANFKLPQEADDVAQQICLNLMNGALESVREPKAFLGFVGRAVHNEIVDRFRRQSRQVSLDQPTARDKDSGQSMVNTMASRGPDPEQQVDAKRLLEKLAGLINSLPAYCAEVMNLYLRYRLGTVTSYRQMAEQLDRPINTVSVQIKRCLDNLRQKPEFLEMFGHTE